MEGTKILHNKYVAKWELPFKTPTAADQSEDATKATSEFQINLRFIETNIHSYLFFFIEQSCDYKNEYK